MVTWRRANMWLTLAWIAVIPVAIVAGWFKSLAFISAISIYANVAGHLAAWRADVPNEGERP